MLAPGPGTYNSNPVNLLSSPGFKVGTSTRGVEDKMKMRVSNFPPPDSYNLNHEQTQIRGPKFSFGSGPQRQSMSQTNLMTPAPNSYAIASKGIEGPKFAMGLKLENLSMVGQE